MGFSCSFNIKVKDITDIIGKDTIKNLTDVECSSTITILSNTLGLSQEQILDKKYKDVIINALNNQRKIAKQVREESTDNSFDSEGTYEVSSAGDKRFSALYATFKPGTIIDGVNVGGKTIENVYQSVIKKSRKGQAPTRTSRLNLNPTNVSEEKRELKKEEVIEAYGNPINYKTSEDIITVTFEKGELEVISFVGSIKDSKGRSLGNKDINYFIGALKVVEDLAGGKEDFSYIEGYLPLWQEWAKQNPQLIKELEEKSRGKTLTDQFANTRVSQARALTDILKEYRSKNKTSVTSNNKPKLIVLGETNKYHSKGEITRKDAENNPKVLYVFTDNTNRTSGKNAVDPNSKYAKKYGKDKKYPGQTLAILRGLDNALPISTQRWYDPATGRTRENGRWEDDAIEEFKKTIDDEFEEIKKAIESGKYEAIALPPKESLFHDKPNKKSISDINKETRPQIYEYIKSKYEELLNLLDTSSTEKTENTKTTSKETKGKKSKGKNTLKENLKSAQAERPVFDSLKIGEIQQKVLSISFPNVAERIAAVEFISNYFSLILDDVVKGFKEDLVANEETLRDNLGDEEYERVYNSMYQGTEAQQRRACLGTKIGDTPTPIVIFNRIKNLIDNFKNAGENDIDTLVYGYYLNKDNTVNTNSYLGREFWYEAQQNGWNTPKKLEEVAIKRVRALMSYCHSKFQSDQVFDALVKEAAFNLEFTEGIRLDTRGNLIENNEEEQDRVDDVETETENPNKEGYMIKYKLINPIDTISERLKKELSYIYRIKTDRQGNENFIFNNWGIRTKLNPMVAYYTMLNEFQSISSEDELTSMFESAYKRYPWLSNLKDKVVFNPNNPSAFSLDFRKEFFRSCKSFAQFSMIDEKGRLVPLNRDNKASTFLDAIKKSYEGHEIFGDNPIWNADGTTNEANIIKLRNLIHQTTKQKTKEEIEAKAKLKSKETNEERKARVEKERTEKTLEMENHPLLMAWQGLLASKSEIKDTKDAIRVERAIQILRGENPRYPRVSLEAVLNNLGVDTNNMDLFTMLPVTQAFDWDDEGHILNEYGEPLSELDIQDKNFKPVFADDFVQWAQENDMTPMEAFNSIVTEEMRRKLSSIFEAVDLMVSPYLGIGHAGSSNDNIVASYQSQYLKIGNALSMANEGYSESSFRFAGDGRFSYVAYDFITRMSNLLTKTETQEQWDRGTKYIEDNYGQYDFFRDPITKEWYNTWAQQLHDDKEIRNEFKVYNILGFGGNDKNNSFGKVQEETLIDNIILAYFNGGQKENTGYAYYRNPLFSDTDAAILVKGVRYSADYNGNEYYDAEDKDRKHPLSWKQIIIRNLSKVLRQEINRISDLLEDTDNPNVTRIEYYNSDRKNGLKFNFFPALNAKDKYTRVLEDYNRMRKNLDAASFKEQSTEYLENLILDIVEGEIDSTGARKGGKLQEFLSMFDDKRLARLRDKIANASSFQSKNKQEDTEENGLNKLFEEEEETAELKGIDNAAIIGELTEFFYNDYFAQSQIIQLFGGDLAYYKNFRDFIKRNKQAYAAGDRLYGMLMDEHGNNVESLIERSLYIEDKFMPSNSYDDIKQLLNSNVGVSEMTRDMILGALNSYKSIRTTDGQSFRSPKGMKKMLQAMGGKWTEAMEQSFNRLQKGKFSTEDFYTIWNNIKPFLFSHETVQVGKRKEKVVTQHKNSEYMLTAFYSLIGSTLSQSPQLRALQEFMDENDIDVIHFHSVVKEGFFNGVNLNYDEEKFEELKDENNCIEVAGHKVRAKTYEDYQENLMNLLDTGEITQEQMNEGLSKVDFSQDDDGYVAAYNQLYDAIISEDEEGNDVINEDMIHKVPLSDYMVVQPSADHLTEDDLMALFGSQLRNIMPADLPVDFAIEIDFNGQKRTLDRDEYVKFYNTLIVDQLLDSFSMVSDQFSDIKKLQAALLNKIHGNPKYGPDIEEALQLNEDGTGFRVPFNNPNLNNKIEELILSTFKNSIQKQKINGGNIILVSNFGLSDNLHVQWKTDENGNKSIDYIPCYMPAYKRTLIQDLLVEKSDPKTGEKYWQVDYNRIKGNEDLLRMIGYRIPTENKYSIFNLRIQGFLPISAGTAIMLPSDIISMSGTDFDIDKLFLMMKNFRREVTDGSFTRAFGDYLNKRLSRLKGKEDEHLVRGFQLLDILKEQDGLTQEELDKFLDKYSAFEEFWNDEGYDLCLDMPNYKSYKPQVNSGITLDDMSKQEGVKLKERKLIRDNMLIDMISKGLSSNAGSQMSMIPGSYTDIKHASRVQQIAKDPKALATFIEQHKEEISKNGLYETLNKYGKDNKNATTEDSIDKLEKFHEKNSTIEDPLSIVDYSKNHRNLMDGNDLIGIFAVSSSSHYKFQFINNGGGLSIAREYQFNVSLDGKTTIKADRIDSVVSPFTGVKIGDYCAQYQAASPDNGKDPTLGDINANPKTSPRVEFLTRIGLDPDTVGVLNTCDDFLTVIKDIVFRQRDSDFDDDYNNWQNFHGSIPRIFDLVTKYRLQGINSFSVEEITEAAQFLGWMDNINNLSKLLRKSSVISRCDSPNGALSISTAEVTQQLFKAKAFMEEVTRRDHGRLIANPSSPILGFEQFIDTDLDAVYADDVREKILNSAVPRVQAAYTLGIRSGYTLASKFNMLPQLSRSVEEAVEYLRQATDSSLTYTNDVRELRQFYNELVMYLLSGEDSRFGTNENSDIMSKRNYYIHDFPMKYKIFMNQKIKNGKYKHDRARNMTLFKCIKISEKDGITFQNVGKVSQLMRKFFSEELDQLLSSTNQEEVAFAEDLFNYAYYANGFNFGPHNYGIFFSNAYYENMPRYLDVLKSRNTQLAISDESTDYLINFVHQFLTNNPKYAKRLRTPNKYFNFKKNEETGEIRMTMKRGMNTNQRNAALAMTATLNGKNTVPIIIVKDKYYGGMYYRISRAVDEPVFVKIKYNKLSTPFYDSSKEVNEIDYSQMKKFGNPSNINKVMDIMNKQNDEKEDSKVTKEPSTTEVMEDPVEPTEDTARTLDSLEAGQEEPENLGEKVPSEDNVDEEYLKKTADYLDAIDKSQNEFESKLEALSDRVSKLEEQRSLDDFSEPSEDNENNMCE